MSWSTLSNISTTFSLPIAVVAIVTDLRRRRKLRREELDEARAKRLLDEKRAFAVLDEGYRRYLELCVEYPDADGFEVTRADMATKGFGDGPRAQRFGLYCYAISLVESAFVLFGSETIAAVTEGGASSAHEPHFEQWQGWALFFEDFARRPDFADAWELAGPSLEGTFYDWASAVVERRRN